MERIWSVDRIEERVAICRGDHGEKQDVPLKTLPEGTCEGDILREANGVFVLDREETQARRKVNADLQKKLRRE